MHYIGTEPLEQLAHSGSTYLLTTTYPERDNDKDIATGAWRPLNLEAAPFSLPKPLTTIRSRRALRVRLKDTQKSYTGYKAVSVCRR